jgi:hypothetical protein
VLTTVFANSVRLKTEHYEWRETNRMALELILMSIIQTTSWEAKLWEVGIIFFQKGVL